LVIAILRHHGPNSRLAQAIGSDKKGNVSTALYAVAVALACVQPAIAHAIYVLVAAMWLVPDSRIESKLS
jgi:hypothetical protein